MRGGYGKNKLFFMVIAVIVGMLMMPYSMQAKIEKKHRENLMEREQSADSAQSTDDMRMTENMADAGTLDPIVEITIKDSSGEVIRASGNGVVLANGENGLCIVTAGHVLDRADADAKVLVGFRDQENWVGAAKNEVGCGRYQIVPDADLAFLFLNKEDVGEVQVVSVCEKQEYDRLTRGDVVRTIGWDEEQKVIYEGELQENWVFVEDFSQYMMAAECVLRPGMSGCGLYNAQDQLIGIACGSNKDGQLVAVPLHVLQARWADIK
ncbi:MAG: trypsin-like peptidase domain-containing protein [Lachnospiraceae bacterium]|nr:trypsin-like peptidase domain-containing protein [Lachnospiraceae bacterium]